MFCKGGKGGLTAEPCLRLSENVYGWNPDTGIPASNHACQSSWFYQETPVFYWPPGVTILPYFFQFINTFSHLFLLLLITCCGTVQCVIHCPVEICLHLRRERQKLSNSKLFSFFNFKGRRYEFCFGLSSWYICLSSPRGCTAVVWTYSVS